MATCGYICPACEGKGHDDNGNTCTWCSVTEVALVVRQSKTKIETEAWITKTHEGNCCAGEE